MPPHRHLRTVGSAPPPPPAPPRRPPARPAGPLDLLVDLLRALAVGAALLVAGTPGTALLLLLLVITSPVGVVVIAWMTWRARSRTATPLARLRARWGSAQVILGGQAR